MEIIIDENDWKTRYSNELKDERWVVFANKIKERDNNKCCFCGSNKDIVVHHLVYYDGEYTEPWEYDENLLITLCNKCHKHYHKNNTHKKIKSNIRYKKLYEKEVIKRNEKQITINNLRSQLKCLKNKKIDSDLEKEYNKLKDYFLASEQSINNYIKKIDEEIYKNKSLELQIFNLKEILSILQLSFNTLLANMLKK